MRKAAMSWMVVLFLGSSVTHVHAQWLQQGSKLVGIGAAGSALQGYSVALSADGNTAIIGGSGDSSCLGAAWVFTRSGDKWTQRGNKLVGTGAVGDAYQGHSVALSADGNTAIVGGYNDSSGAGAAWVFTRSGYTWTQQGSKLVGTGAVGSAYQGWAVALSSDGNTAIIGGYKDNGSIGAAWVFTRFGSTWTQQGEKLVGSGVVGDAWQGGSLALSSDGNTAIVGGGGDNGGIGAAWVFIRSGNEWWQQGSKLVGAGAVGTAYQGHSVALSADGNTAIVGGYNDSSGAGAAWVFTRSGYTWTQQGSKLVGTGGVGEAQQGWSVSLSSDGNMAMIGGPWDNSRDGAAWVFTRFGSTWTQQGSKLMGTGAVMKAGLGWSVSLSDDGNTAIMGGYYDDNLAGAAWVFTGPRPTVIRVADVPSDQGGKVLVMWQCSGYDAFPQQVITSYGVYRGVKASSLPKTTDLQKFRKVTHDRVTGELVYWEHFGDVTPRWLDAYSLPVETLSDSTAYGNPEYYFMVTATSSDPPGFWESPPDSGYSVDNLAPAAPVSLSGSVELGNVSLKWKSNREADLCQYAIYRSSSPITQISGLDPLSEATDTTFLDTSPIAGNASFYAVCAVDVHGNFSKLSNKVSFVPEDFALNATLTAFTAQVSGHGVELNWKTASEIDNAGFIVLRKMEGDDELKEISNYKSNSALKGLGTSAEGKSYTFTDNSALRIGRYIYQLETMTTKGAITKYHEISVDVAAPTQFALYQNYPNPFNPSTTIRFDLKESVEVTLMIYNSLGQRVLEQNYGTMGAGRYEKDISMAQLPSGLYFYRIAAGGFTKTMKLVLVK